MACGGTKVTAKGKTTDDSKVVMNESKETITSKEIKKENDSSNESKSQKKIVLFADDNARHSFTKIKFTNGVTIDVRDINPYRDLPYKTYRKDPNGFEYFYDLSEKSKSEQDKIIEGCRINPDAYRDGNFLKIFVKAPVIEVTDSLVAIAYHKSYYSNEEDILCTQGVTIIYDYTGKEINRIEDKKDGFYDIRLSNDGKYLMQKYGVDYGEDGSGQLDRGFKFYYLQNGKMIFKVQLGKDQFLGGYNFIPKKSDFATYFRYYGKFFESYVIDLINKSVYKKVVDRKKYFNNPEFRKTLSPNFLKTKNVSGLIKDGYKKIY